MQTRYQEEIFFYEGGEILEQVAQRSRSILNFFFPSNILEDVFISKRVKTGLHKCENTYSWVLKVWIQYKVH